MLEQRAEMGAESAGLRTVKSVDLSGLKLWRSMGSAWFPQLKSQERGLERT